MFLIDLFILISVLTILVPHPLFANFELRVQTDGEKSPRDALVDCARGIIADLGQLSREFTKEFELRKMVAGEGSSANPTEK
jgi:DNA-directed RNA polymerase II subunit RPB11